MSKARLVALLFLLEACHHELRSRNPDLWLELQTEHFTLQTDVPEPQARRMIDDLEYLRHALIAAQFRSSQPIPGRIAVLALASLDEVNEFLPPDEAGLTFSDPFTGLRTCLMSGADGVFDANVLKHEVMHALLSGYLINDPRWVSEGLATYVEGMDIDRAKGVAVRGPYHWQRRSWVRAHNFSDTRWSAELIGAGGDFHIYDGFSWETMAWVFTHFLIDTRPAQFNRFLARLARGEAMWPSFNGEFPELTEARMTAEVHEYVQDRESLLKAKVALPAFTSPPANLRRMRRAEVHAVRALLSGVETRGLDPAKTEARFNAEVALALAADPAEPVLPLLTTKVDPKAAVEAHPDSGLSWLALYIRDPKDLAPLRKATALMPDNFVVLSVLAREEAQAGQTSAALAHAEQALKLGHTPLVFDAQSFALEAAGRCAEAVAAQQRAIDALSDETLPAAFERMRTHLEKLNERCGQSGGTRRRVEVAPVLISCHQPLLLGRDDLERVHAKFTIREDGSVTSVAVVGEKDTMMSERIRSFVESCQFEPMVIEGQRRPVQLDLTLQSFVH